MRANVTFTFDENDGGALAPERLDDVFNLLRNHVREGEDAELTRHPGIRGLRKVRGNQFTAEDVDAFRAYALELCRRAESNVAELRAELARLDPDPFSRRAYEALIAGTEDSRLLAIRILDEFVEAFLAETASVPKL